MAEYFGWPAIAKALGVSVVTARSWHKNLGLLVYKRNRTRSSPPPFSRWCWVTDDSLILAWKIARAQADRESVFGKAKQEKTGKIHQRGNLVGAEHNRQAQGNGIARELRGLQPTRGAAVAQVRGVLAERVVISTQLDPFLSLRALAAYSDVSIRKLREFLEHPQHPLPCYRIGGKILGWT